MKENFDIKECEQTLDHLGLLLEYYDSLPQILNFENVKTMKLAYDIIKKLSYEYGGTVSYEINTPYKRCGYVIWKARYFSFDDTRALFFAFSLCDVVEISAYADNTLGISLAFNHLTDTIYSYKE